jgi:hypothetical protein
MSFAAMVTADVLAVSTSDEVGEELLYRPDGAATHTVLAIVARHPLKPNEVAQRQSGQKVFEVVISKDATSGRTSIAKGLDKIDVPPTRGAAAVTMRVVDILNEGVGSWKLKVVA